LISYWKQIRVLIQNNIKRIQAENGNEKQVLEEKRGRDGDTRHKREGEVKCGGGWIIYAQDNGVL
jgi:hypothetical protein